MLYIIRHGETEWNRLGRIQGSSDTLISENGEAEARLLARLLKNLRFDRFIVSDLVRAKRTAEILAGPSIPRSFDQRLRERFFGKYEGQTLPEIMIELNKRFAFDQTQFDPVGEWPDQEEVEPLDRLLERAWSVVKEVREEIEHKHIALVTHGNVVQVLLGRVLQIPAGVRRVLRLPNCCCFELESRHGRLMLRSMVSPEMLGCFLPEGKNGPPAPAAV